MTKFYIVDDLLTKVANNVVEEANQSEQRTVMEDGVCGRVAFSAGMGSAMVREW